MLHIQIAALALAATALVVSGCGSSKAASTTTASTTAATSTVTTTPIKLATGTPLTRAQLIAQGDAICASTLTKFGTITVKTKAEFLRVLPEGAIYLTTEAEELGKLVPPASMIHDWTQIVNDIHFASEYTTRSDRYFKEKQANTANQLYAKANKLVKQSRVIAARDGFKRCSSPE